MVIESVRIVPKIDGKIAPLSMSFCGHEEWPKNSLREQGRLLPRELQLSWQPDKHLAFPKMNRAYILQYGAERVVYGKAPVYAEGGTAKCYIGQRDNGEFCLVRRRHVPALEAPDAGYLSLESSESEARKRFAPDLAPFWQVARQSNKEADAFKVYSVEPLLIGAAFGMSSYVKRVGGAKLFGAFLHHFMQGVAAQLEAMHVHSSGQRGDVAPSAHNDVKTDNICMQKDHDEDSIGLLTYRLIDFELTQRVGQDLLRSNVNIRPHELVRGDGICRSAPDMFSFGLACMQLLLDEEPYGEIARQDMSALGFTDRHLWVLEHFETARRAMMEDKPVDAHGPPLVLRFVKQWRQIKSILPAYLVEILQECLAAADQVGEPGARRSAKEVQERLARHPVSNELRTELAACYRGYVDDKQVLCKITAAVLAGAVNNQVRGLKGFDASVPA